MKNDLISRQEAIDEIINLWVEKPFGNPAIVEIKDCIEKLPAAQPTPCDVCRYNPPSSMDGKPCCVCPAERRTDEGSD